MQELTVRNPKRARVGDTVKIGLVKRVQFAGYWLAYVIPAAALVLGAVGGHFLGTYAGFPSLDIIAGFVSLIVASFFSFRRLKRLDAVSAIEIVHVHTGPWNPSCQSEEETVSDYYLSYY
jgi:positive regulator of sigma E activity